MTSQLGTPRHGLHVGLPLSCKNVQLPNVRQHKVEVHFELSHPRGGCEDRTKDCLERNRTHQDRAERPEIMTDEMGTRSIDDISMMLQSQLINMAFADSAFEANFYILYMQHMQC